MANRTREKKSNSFRLAFMDDKTHKQLVTLHFTRTSFFITIITIFVVLCAAIYSVIAYTPVKTFIPGYPDARSKRAAIQNVITIDSLERVILRWELYSENLRRAIEGEEPLKIDSLINAAGSYADKDIDMEALVRQDSLLRQHVREEEQFGISQRGRRDLPIEGMHFFTPLKGVISQGYDPAIHPYMDITAPAGTVVKATLDGTVIFAGWNDETGYTIHLQHDGDIVSIYKHNEKILKNTGDKVTAGSPIALVGSTGELTTGEHLHFELWHKGETVDPSLYIKF
ncbi:MAG: M23 family metallopeptidase [Bacteroidales bacterium]|nr:M23 family metallopeptidase [Bacteroidales bacterium]